MRLSTHTALHLSAMLSLLVMTFQAQRPEVTQEVGLNWPLEVPHATDVIHLRGRKGHRLPAHPAHAPVSFKDDGFNSTALRWAI